MCRSNHEQIFRSAGFQKIREYRYWNKQNKCIDIDCMIADLDKAPKM
jgi:aspartate/tyrosine/aromatic aminotransferase